MAIVKEIESMISTLDGLGDKNDIKPFKGKKIKNVFTVAHVVAKNEDGCDVTVKDVDEFFRNYIDSREALMPLSDRKSYVIFWGGEMSDHLRCKEWRKE